MLVSLRFLFPNGALSPWLPQDLSSILPMEYGTAWKPPTRPQRMRKETRMLVRTAVNDIVFGLRATGEWLRRRKICGGGPGPGYLWLISNAGIRKRNAGLPSPVAAACGLLSTV